MTYLYRGADTEMFAEGILSNGRLPGSEAKIVRGAIANPHATVTKRTPISELNWGSAPRAETTAVTAGLTHIINETSRFRDVWGVALVLDNSGLPFSRCPYEYDWFDERPGSLAQLLQTADGEVRLDDRGLWGVISVDHWAEGDSYLGVEYWGRDNLPATSPQSAFADENEWMVAQDGVDVSSAIEGLVSIQQHRNIGIRLRSELDDRGEIREDRSDIPLFYDLLVEELGHPSHPLYLLVYDRDATPVFDASAYAVEAIKYVYDGDGFIAPAALPSQFRGVSH